MQIAFDDYLVFFVLEHFTRHIHFLLAHRLLINTWPLKLIWPINTSLCVLCIATWKHFMSSLWMNTTNFIFWLLHIANLLLLIVLIPPCSPCIPSTNCAHSSANYVDSPIDYDHAFVDYTNFFVECANKSNDCVKTLDD